MRTFVTLPVFRNLFWTKIISSNSTLDVIQVCISNGGKE